MNERRIQEVIAATIPPHIDYETGNIVLIDVSEQTAAEFLKRLLRIVLDTIVLEIDCSRLRQVFKPVESFPIFKIERFGSRRNISRRDPVVT